jgi:hypothetical protein
MPLSLFVVCAVLGLPARVSDNDSPVTPLGIGVGAGWFAAIGWGILRDYRGTSAAQNLRAGLWYWLLVGLVVNVVVATCAGCSAWFGTTTFGSDGGTAIHWFPVVVLVVWVVGSVSLWRLTRPAVRHTA